MVPTISAAAAAAQTRAAVRPLPAAVIAVAALLLASTQAFASSFAGTSAGTSAGGTSASSGSTSGDDKVVLAAREDAAGFVATDGELRTVRLDAALRHLRSRDPVAAAASDLALARAILSR